MDKLHRVAQYLFLEEKMSGEKFADIMVRDSQPKPAEPEEKPAETAGESGEEAPETAE